MLQDCTLHLLIAICLFLFSPLLLQGQNTIGLPEVVNYPKEKYKAGTQNRQIRQDKAGRMYFANNDGLLVFNGKNWQTYPLPNRTIIRSIEFGTDDKIYVGGQDEFGYFSPNKNGQLVFYSLKHLIPENDRSFADVWKIVFFEESIFFQTTVKIFQISGNNCTVYPGSRWQFIGKHSNRLIAQDFDRGLLELVNGDWIPFSGDRNLLTGFLATDIVGTASNSSLLSTLNGGLFLLIDKKFTKFSSPFLNEVAKKNITGITQISDKRFALSTNLGGCFIIDDNGNLIQSFSRKEGLQNNNVLSVFLDKEKNLWLGLDNGIDFIAYSSAVKHLYFDQLNEGSGYAAKVFKDKLYLGTSTGLFSLPLYSTPDLSFVRGYFQPVINTEGQVWSLSEVNGQLLMGHNDGAFLINDRIATILDKTTGYWTFYPLTGSNSLSQIVGGSYRGLEYFKLDENRLQKRSDPTLFESARYVVVDGNSVWVAHPYKGIFRISYNNNIASIKKYGDREGVISNNGNFIFKIKNRIILTTTHGVYEWNASKNIFDTSAYYNNLFPGKSIRYLKEDANGNIWFVFDKLLGVVDNAAQKPQLIYFPELTDKFVSGFEFVYALNSQNIFIGGDKGFYHINYEQYKKLRYPLQVQIAVVKAFNMQDSLLFGGYSSEVNTEALQTIKGNRKINHSWNSFHFSYAAPVYAQQANIAYSYMLEPFDKSWSAFSDKAEKEYTNLPAGSFVFKVKARNNLGNESSVSSYSFTVLPPWYKTLWAYLLYCVLIAFAGYRLYRHQKKKFVKQQNLYKEEQRQLQYLHQLEIDKSEKELVKLRNEKLEAEILLKNSELASTSMHLLQKGDLLVKVKDQMLKLKNSGDDETGDVKKILRTISDEDKVDEQWNHFSFHFDKTHGDFLRNLKAKFPNISNNEMKLCAYLRMNLSTKEVAQLMNISVRGVEISRYRLRKKLAVPKEMNLFDFLLQATNE